MSMTLQEIAALVGGKLEGDGAAVIHGVGPIEEARPDQIAALDDARFLAQALASKAAALLVPQKLAEQIARPKIVVGFPQIAQNQVIEKLGLWKLP